MGISTPARARPPCRHPSRMQTMIYFFPTRKQNLWLHNTLGTGVLVEEHRHHFEKD